MATSISGNVRLVYGTHTHNETYNTTSEAYTYSNPVNQYAAGSGRAVYHDTTSVFQLWMHHDTLNMFKKSCVRIMILTVLFR